MFNTFSRVAKARQLFHISFTLNIQMLCQLYQSFHSLFNKSLLQPEMIVTASSYPHPAYFRLANILQLVLNFLHESHSACTICKQTMRIFKNEAGLCTGWLFGNFAVKYSFTNFILKNIFWSSFKIELKNLFYDIQSIPWPQNNHTGNNKKLQQLLHLTFLNQLFSDENHCTYYCVVIFITQSLCGIKYIQILMPLDTCLEMVWKVEHVPR